MKSFDYQEYQRRYRLEHKEEQRAYAAEWYRRNKKRRAAKSRAWARKNFNRMLFLQHRWVSRNKERAAFHSRRAYIRSYGCVPQLALSEWLEIKRAARGRCLRCKRRRVLTVDHVVPLSKGGDDRRSNIQPLCLPCNTAKGNRTMDYRS